MLSLRTIGIVFEKRDILQKVEDGAALSEAEHALMDISLAETIHYSFFNLNILSMSYDIEYVKLELCQSHISLCFSSILHVQSLLRLFQSPIRAQFMSQSLECNQKSNCYAIWVIPYCDNSFNLLASIGDSYRRVLRETIAALSTSVHLSYDFDLSTRILHDQPLI